MSRQKGYYIDLEPRRQIEIDSLLSSDNGSSQAFKNKESYHRFLANTELPVLPWETVSKLLLIKNELITSIKEYEKKLNLSPKTLSLSSKHEKVPLLEDIKILREYRKTLQDNELRKELQDIKKIELLIDNLENINNFDNKAILLEKYLNLALNALNDALQIKANYPTGDDNEPTFTAPANKPDIECFYDDFNAICEVTMLGNRTQWYNEGQPVMRHLRDFEDKCNNKVSYCIFVAPKIHRDTLNTFWTSVKYEYEGQKQKIIPFTIKDIIQILKTLIILKKNKLNFKYTHLSQLLNMIISHSEKCNNSLEWLNSIPNHIETWHKDLSGQV